MEKNNRKYLIFVYLFIICGLLSIGVGVYYLFIKEDSSKQLEIVINDNKYNYDCADDSCEVIYSGYNYAILKDNDLLIFNSTNSNVRKIEKVATYKGEDKNLELYDVDWKNHDNSDKYLLAYDNKYYKTEERLNSEIDNYDNIHFCELSGCGQNYSGSFFVNQKTKELISYNQGSLINFYETTNGYFFVNFPFDDNFYNDGPFNHTFIYTDKITTSTGKTLIGNGEYTVKGDNLAIADNNEFIVYDVNGNKVLSLKCEKIYLINDGYALIKMNNKYYNIEVSNPSKMKEVTIDKNINIDEVAVFKLNNEEMQYYGDDFVYKYNFATKKISTVY